jgi:hypothetical protein
MTQSFEIMGLNTINISSASLSENVRLMFPAKLAVKVAQLENGRPIVADEETTKRPLWIFLKAEVIIALDFAANPLTP